MSIVVSPAQSLVPLYYIHLDQSWKFFPKNEESIVYLVGSSITKLMKSGNICSQHDVFIQLITLISNNIANFLSRLLNAMCSSSN